MVLIGIVRLINSGSFSFVVGESKKVRVPAFRFTLLLNANLNLML
jgi:hypothetical protein